MYSVERFPVFRFSDKLSSMLVEVCPFLVWMFQGDHINCSPLTRLYR